MIANDFFGATEDDRIIDELLWEFKIHRALKDSSARPDWKNMLFFAINQNERTINGKA